MSHDTPTITARRRERTGSRYSQRLRSQGRLPAVIYGHQEDPIAIDIDEKEMLFHLHHGVHLLNVTVDNAGTETCLVKDLQFGWLGDNVIHVDFARVDLHEEVTVSVPIEFHGEPEAAKKAGAILTHNLTQLEVTCTASAIPESIVADLSGLDGTFTVGDLQLPPGVHATAEPEAVVAQISFVHEETVGEEAEMPEAAAEPEVLTEAKPDEEAAKPTDEEA
ncbi:MAG: 50S ribosomal protein L25 [Planctomycetota bacterium]|jgi:large subunit ribosomal protein L25